MNGRVFCIVLPGYYVIVYLRLRFAFQNFDFALRSFVTFAPDESHTKRSSSLKYTAIMNILLKAIFKFCTTQRLLQNFKSTYAL